MNQQSSDYHVTYRTVFGQAGMVRVLVRINCMFPS